MRILNPGFAFWVVLTCCASVVQAAGPTLNLDHPSRSEKEKARDRNWSPVETLGFFGLRNDMRVLELFPGSEWYTKLLGPYLAEHGGLYISLGTNEIEGKLSDFGLDKVVTGGSMKNFEKTDAPGYIFSVDSIDLQETNLDIVLIFRNAHNFGSAGRTTLNRAVFAALKPGNADHPVQIAANHRGLS